jgi:hypothetical protein
MLQNIVTQYNQGRGPGEFVVYQEGENQFSIVGAGIRTPNGSVVQVKPLLDQVIALPQEDVPAGTAVGLIIGALSKSSGTKVKVGTIPLNLLGQIHGPVGGTQALPAREVLKGVLQESPYPLSWQLRYDADMKSFYLNIVPATRSTTDSFGRRMEMPL